ncbi:MAG TPA: S8 family peptidase [Salinibacter sp.]|nr:S8 family peptidase [Salinibacter sp.]
MHRLQLARRFALFGVLAIALVFTGCDQSSSPTATETGSSKPNVESDFQKKAPADRPGDTELPGEGTSELIPGQYIVVLNDEAVSGKSKAAVRSVATELLGKSADVKNLYSTALTGFAARNITEDKAASLEEESRVKYVEQDRTVHAVASQSNATWGLDRVDARSGLDDEYTYDADGSGVNAYILDTGINTSHQEFGSRASVGYDAIGDGQNGQDCNGHGTHVAGTVGGSTYGVAKDVNLIAVRVLDCQGGGSLSGVIDGIDWVTQNHQDPAVANMSLGGGDSQSLDDAVNNSIDAGVTYAVAAGNDDADACNSSPAQVADALTVGSTTSNDSRSSFSNYGSCVDIFAPGTDITSAWYTSDSATNTISGTSMASPHVAGAVALFLENNTGASPSTAFSKVTDTATQGAISGVNGSPNLLLYSLLESSDGGGGDDGGDDGGDGGGDDGGDDTAPCSNCSKYTGSLSGSGDAENEPDGTYYAGNGNEVGYLRGPSDADFDLYLYKWNGWYWEQVASATSSNADEDISYSGSDGYYYWEVYSYSGSGSFDFYLE